jgi:hypothetical protein
MQRIRESVSKETQAISFINQTYQTKTKEQCRHMSLYLLPVAEAMRKPQIIDSLKKWIEN